MISLIVVLFTISNKNIVFAAGQNMEYETCTCANSLLRPGPIQGNVTSVVEFEGAKVTCCIILGSCKKGL